MRGLLLEEGEGVLRRGDVLERRVDEPLRVPFSGQGEEGTFWLVIP